MPTTYTRRFTIEGVKPIYDRNANAEQLPVKLPASVTYPAGTVLCEIKGVSEIQLLTPGGTISGGTWTITFGGQTTSALAYNATAATIQAALEALSTVGVGNIAVSGGPISSGNVTLTFQNDLGYTNVAQVTVGTGSLTGSSPTLTPSTSTGGVAATSGVWKKYSSASTDGSQLGPCVILEYACATDSSGNITMGDTAGGGVNAETPQNVPAWTTGDFLCTDVPDMTDAMLTLFGGRLVHGTIAANGVFRLP